MTKRAQWLWLHGILAVILMFFSIWAVFGVPIDEEFIALPAIILPDFFLTGTTLPKRGIPQGLDLISIKQWHFLAPKCDDSIAGSLPPESVVPTFGLLLGP